MDIKPFVPPELTMFSAVNGLIATGLILSVLAIIAVIFAEVKLKKTRAADWSPMVSLAAMLGIMLSAGFAADGTHQLVTDARKAHVATFENSLASEGFKILSGSPDLNQNAQSSLLLSYNDKSFACDLFSPKDVNSTVVFSCGEAKLSLTQIKEAS